MPSSIGELLSESNPSRVISVLLEKQEQLLQNEVKERQEQLAMGVPFQKDMAEVNLKILSNHAPEATTSMQRDIMAGKQSEIDGLVYEVVRMGEEYHVPVPAYEKVAEKLRAL